MSKTEDSAHEKINFLEFFSPEVNFIFFSHLDARSLAAVEQTSRQGQIQVGDYKNTQQYSYLQDCLVALEDAEQALAIMEELSEEQRKPKVRYSGDISAFPQKPAFLGLMFTQVCYLIYSEGISNFPPYLLFAISSCFCAALYNPLLSYVLAKRNNYYSGAFIWPGNKKLFYYHADQPFLLSAKKLLQHGENLKEKFSPLQKSSSTLLNLFFQQYIEKNNILTVSLTELETLSAQQTDGRHPIRTLFSAIKRGNAIDFILWYERHIEEFNDSRLNQLSVTSDNGKTNTFIINDESCNYFFKKYLFLCTVFQVHFHALGLTLYSDEDPINIATEAIRSNSPAQADFMYFSPYKITLRSMINHLTIFKDCMMSAEHRDEWKLLLKASNADIPVTGKDIEEVYGYDIDPELAAEALNLNVDITEHEGEHYFNCS